MKNLTSMSSDSIVIVIDEEEEESAAALFLSFFDISMTQAVHTKPQTTVSTQNYQPSLIRNWE